MLGGTRKQKNLNKKNKNKKSVTSKMSFPVKFTQYSVLEVGGERYESVQGFVSDGNQTYRYSHPQNSFPPLENALCSFNVPTRGFPCPYSKLGILKGVSNYPLFGRQRFPGSQEWEYYTEDNSRHMNKIPIPRKGYKFELYNHDTVHVPGVGSCEVELYPRQLPLLGFS